MQVGLELGGILPQFMEHWYITGMPQNTQFKYVFVFVVLRIEPREPFYFKVRSH